MFPKLYAAKRHMAQYQATTRGGEALHSTCPVLRVKEEIATFASAIRVHCLIRQYSLEHITGDNIPSHTAVFNETEILE